MSELFMQISINENKLNRKISYDNIIKIKNISNSIIIYDVNGWFTTIEKSKDITITIEFTEIMIGV